MEDLRLDTPVLLDETHITTSFHSGHHDLDDWLKRRALGNQASGASKTYVVIGPSRRVVGFYALSSGSIASSDVPGWLRRNMPNPIPIALLGRLAIDQTFQSRGIGTALLQDAVLRVRAAAGILGIRGILVHALTEEARNFYRRFGFVEAMPGSMTLVLSLAKAPEALSRSQ